MMYIAQYAFMKFSVYTKYVLSNAVNLMNVFSPCHVFPAIYYGCNQFHTDR